MRKELMDLFNLSSPDFKIKDLLKVRWHTEGHSVDGGYLIEGYGGAGGGHGSGGADGGHGSSGA